MRLLVDEKLMPLRLDQGRTILDGISGAEFYCKDFATRSANTRHEVVAIAGLGVAVASLVVAVLQLIRSPSDQKTTERLLSAISAQLVASRSPVAEIKYDESDIIDVVNLTGMPCELTIRFHGGEHILVYLGATSAEVYVSAVDPDWRSLISD